MSPLFANFAFAKQKAEVYLSRQHFRLVFFHLSSSPLSSCSFMLLPKGVIPFCLKGVVPFCLKGCPPPPKGGFAFCQVPPRPFPKGDWGFCAWVGEGVPAPLQPSCQSGSASRLNIFACFPSCDGVFCRLFSRHSPLCLREKPTKTTRHKNRNQAKPNDRFGLKAKDESAFRHRVIRLAPILLPPDSGYCYRLSRSVPKSAPGGNRSGPPPRG